MYSLLRLLPGILLVILYLSADTFLKPLEGGLAILFLGALELVCSAVRERKFDRLVFWTTLLFALPGLASPAVPAAFFPVLQSLVIEAGCCVLLGVAACSRADLNAVMPASFRERYRLSQGQQQEMRRTLKGFLLLFSAHFLLALAVTLWLEGEAASFVRGPLLYVLAGLYLVFLFLRPRLRYLRYRRAEWLPVVDEEGHVRGKAPRPVCHSGSMLLHPVVHLHILDGNGGIFLQKRSMTKKLLPGKWDTAVGGHIALGEKVEDALKRETWEELGISRMEARFLGRYVWESGTERELVFTFLCTSYDRIRIDNDEVDEGRFWGRGEIEEGIREGVLTPNFVHEYNRLLAGLKPLQKA